MKIKLLLTLGLALAVTPVLARDRSFRLDGRTYHFDFPDTFKFQLRERGATDGVERVFFSPPGLAFPRIVFSHIKADEVSENIKKFTSESTHLETGTKQVATLVQKSNAVWVVKNYMTYIKNGTFAAYAGTTYANFGCSDPCTLYVFVFGQEKSLEAITDKISDQLVVQTAHR